MLVELHRTQQLHPDQSQVSDNRRDLIAYDHDVLTCDLHIPGCGGGIA